MPSLYERLRDDGEILLNGPVPLMRFTLTYDGRLLAQSKGNGRKDLKHEMREQFHKQLAELWDERSYLRKPLATWRKWPHLRDSWARWAQAPGMSHWDILKAASADLTQAVHTTRREAARATTGASSRYSSRPRLVPHSRFEADSLRKLQRAEDIGIIVPFQRGPFTFFPLATTRWDLVCDLDIIFLRAEMPGALFSNSRGDLDNRLKVLFDALTMPKDGGLPETAAPDPTQDPFFCLLEDDKLITSFRVSSERLLDEPPGSHRVQLVIRVTIKTRRVNLTTLALEGD